MAASTPSIVCRLTGPAPGAVAVIGLRGADVPHWLQRGFRNSGKRAAAKDPTSQSVDRSSTVDAALDAGSMGSTMERPSLAYGAWHGGRDGVGEAVVVVRHATNDAEVQCHGGIAASRLILDDLQRFGATLVDRDRWLEATCGDPFDGLLRAAWIDAPTERTMRLVTAQSDGRLRADFEALQDAQRRGDRNRYDALRRQWWRWSSLACHLAEPWKVVIAGPANVGKSSLLNALVGFERAIADPTAGTTRDVVHVTTAIDGWPVALFDTAGLRGTENAIEREGIQRAHAAIEQADLMLVVVDATEGSTTTHEELARAARGIETLWVWNKIDCLAGSQGCDAAVGGLRVSAATGEGLEELQRAISARLVPALPKSDEPMPVSRAMLELFPQETVEQ
jgi:tRNA modification GTPase